MARHQLKRYGPLFLVIALGIALVLSFPYLASAYHLEAGARALDNPPLALGHLQKAIERDPDNAQAYRLMGRVYRAEGQWAQSVEALVHFSELRPDNPLGNIELAEVYEQIETVIADSRFADLTHLLPRATVETPGSSVDTPYSQTGQAPWHGYVAASAFHLPPQYDDRPTLFMHAPSKATYSLSLPQEPAFLFFGLGIAPEVLDKAHDGATFRVLVNDQPIFNEHLTTAAASLGWQERAVDLSAWSGQDISLTLSVAPGPSGDPANTWAGWGRPQIARTGLDGLLALRSSVQLVDLWRRAGVTAKEMLNRGASAREAGLYDDALTWYQRAMRLEPDLGDTWYHLGLLHGAQNEWQQALEAFDHALTQGRLVQVGLSSLYYQMGLIYQQQAEPPQLDNALDAYLAALEADAFGSTREIARTHARLGQIYYGYQQDDARAEAELLRSIEIDPRDKWLYIMIGDIYLMEGRTSEAKAMFERALKVAPEFKSAQTRLDALKEDQ